MKGDRIRTPTYVPRRLSLVEVRQHGHHNPVVQEVDVLLLSEILIIRNIVLLICLEYKTPHDSKRIGLRTLGQGIDRISLKDFQGRVKVTELLITSKSKENVGSGV